MRSEQLHRCAEFPGLAEIINGSMYLIDLIDEAALREAIVRPGRRVFEKWKLALGSKDTAPFDPNFVDWLVSESRKLRESLVHKPDQLPLMQHALRLIWCNAIERWSKLDSDLQDLAISFQDKPELEELAGVGFLRGCLNVAANRAFEDAASAYIGGSADVRTNFDADRMLRAFFVALAHRDDRGNWARRLVIRRELVDLIKDRPLDADLGLQEISFDDNRFDAALNVFISRGYLMMRHAQDAASGRAYEVCHEALIRHWRRYQRWLNEAGDVARALRQVAENLLPGQGPEVTVGWPELEPYRNSPWDWWAWIRAVRERRAGGIVSEYNREKLGLLFGQEAKFGSRWARNELANFLNERDRQRGSPSKEQQRYESEAEGLLSAVKNAYVLATAPRLVFPRAVAGFPSYLLDYAKHPDNRLTVFSVASILLAASAAFVMFSIWQRSLAQEAIS